jgi:hypothetical protein
VCVPDGNRCLQLLLPRARAHGSLPSLNRNMTFRILSEKQSGTGSRGACHPRTMAGIEDMDGDFNFCKDRRRDPFHGNSVRLRGARGCKWQMNDLDSLNPAILAKNRSVKAIHSSTSSATYIPVTAVDMCSSISVGGVLQYGREQEQVLGKREAWDEVLEALQEHAVSVRSSDYNKSRRTNDLLYELPIIGHVISTGDDDVSQSLHWPILNGKACVPPDLHCNRLYF